MRSTASYRLCVLVLCLASACVHAQQGGQTLQKGDFVAICGDSITEQKLYSVYIQNYLLMCKPVGVDGNLRAMQFGWSGETSWGFLQKMPKEALRFKMNVATTCYGMNDGGYAPLSEERAKKYRDAMTGIVRAFKDHGVRFVVVGSPGCVDLNTFKPKEAGAAEMYNKTLAGLRDIAREVAAQEGVIFANVYDAMFEAMTKGKAKYGSKYYVPGADGFHPGPNGQLVMAYAFLKALGCDGEIGTIAVDLAGRKADGGEAHKVLSVGDGTVEVESSRYPFCFYGDPASPSSTSGIVEFMPFNQDLNRFTLIVRGAPGDRVRVTWGKNSKEFAKADLEKGINLAAEFPVDNPFGEPFKKVEGLIRKQQNAETPLVKKTLHDLATKKDVNKEEGEKKAQEEMANAKRLFDEAAAAAQVPVKHTIRIEAVK